MREPRCRGRSCFGVVVKAASGEAYAGHDAVERDVVESVLVEEFSGAGYDLASDLGAVASGVGHGLSFLW